MSFKRRREKYINDVDEFNALLRWTKEHKFVCMAEYQGHLSRLAYVDDKMTKTELTVQKDGIACTYIFSKDERENDAQTSGMSAYIALAKSFNASMGYKIPEYDRELGAATAILAYRPEYEGKRVNAYSYDQNSSYGWALKQPMPDTREMTGYKRVVQAGEIGFIYDDSKPISGFEQAGDTSLKIRLAGEHATYIFPIMESPFKGFADRWYSKKVNAKTPEEKAKAKQTICYSVGYLQRKNPFLRAAVVEWANRYIANLIDENTIYVNTDCLVSLVPRDDIPMGKGLGEFKQDHVGEFAFVGFNYQWNMEVPTYRGIPKTWFKEGWDILKDPSPCYGNKYNFNAVTLQMEEMHYDCLKSC